VSGVTKQERSDSDKTRSVRFVPPHAWSLWRRPRGVVIYILAVDSAAAVITIALSAWLPVKPKQWLYFLILTACCVLYTEISRGIEKFREAARGVPHVDVNSVWMFAAVLLLPPGLTAIVVVTCYGYLWLRISRHVVHRQVFSTAATILATHVAYAVLALGTPFYKTPGSLSGFVVVVTAGLLYLAVNTLLITVAIISTTHEAGIRDALGAPGDYALEASTIALGIMLAWSLLAWPAVATLIVGITFALHRGSLTRQLREQARTDSKTGLLNLGGWTESARSEFERARRYGQPMAVLMLDLDHFKRINDRHGHLAGDDVLRAVATTIRTEVRAYDIVGRFGGEEFVVLLNDVTWLQVHEIAERIRRQIAALAVAVSSRSSRSGPVVIRDLSTSIGAALYPDHGSTLEELLHAADRAVYEAKAAGRDQVRLAGQSSAGVVPAS